MTGLPATLRLQAHLVGREFKLKYRRSLLGWLWAFAQPLSRLAIFAFIFTRVIPLGIPNYPLFLFTGIVAWTWFANGTLSAMASPLKLRFLLFQPINRFILPNVSVASDLIDFLLALAVLGVFALASGTRLGWSLLFVPVIMVFQFLLIVGLGSLFATAHVWARDTQKIIEVLLTLGFYVTPVFYRASQIPERFRWMTELNPMAHLISAYRATIIEGVFPDPRSFTAAALGCVLAAGLGNLVYRQFSMRFVDEL